MTTILDSVTEFEDRVIDTVKTIQEPVVDYVRKGVERAEGRLPKLSYPDTLPKPSEVVDSQFSFARKLLDTQRSFATELVDAVSPLVRPEADKPKATPKPAAKATTKPSAKKSSSKKS